MAESYFERVKQYDLIQWCRGLLAQSGYKLRDADGKFYVETSIAWDTPWHHVYHMPNLDCHLWHKIIFDTIYRSMGKLWVPRSCHNCYKVVVRVNKLKQLFALLELQKRMGRPSKCGAEVRETVHGLYGGYFYNWGLEAGRECYGAVRKEIDADPLLGPGTRVILKRACTEYELHCGPSDKWEVSEEQEFMENLIARWFVSDVINRSQSDHALASVHHRWIRWAYQWADETVLEFTNGKPLYPPPVTYHDKKE